jgi:hypothetical protein
MPKVPVNGDGTGALQRTPAPNPDLLRKDPMAEMFGPGSGVKLYGEQEDEVPDEVRAVIESYGLDKKQFQCTLKEIPKGSSMSDSGSSTTTTVHLRGFSRGIPSPDYIAREYGPGDYMLCFTWQTKDDDGVRRMKREEVPITISEKVMNEYKKQRLSSKIKEASEIGTQVREALVEKSIEGELIHALTGRDVSQNVPDPKTSAKKYIEETIETAKMIGLSPYAQQAPARSIEWDKIIPAAATVITAFLSMQQQAEQRRSDEFNKMLMLMMGNSQTANNQLLEVMKVQSGTGSGNMAIREFKDMVLGALDIKDALSGNNRETLGDKIFRLVESVAPSILAIAATTAQNANAVRNNPAVQMAKGYIETNPDFKALKNDPVEMKKVIDNMDRTYGWVQVDHILNTMGWPRPADCPRLDELKDPAPDDNSRDVLQNVSTQNVSSSDDNPETIAEG